MSDQSSTDKQRGVHPHTFLLPNDQFQKIQRAARKQGVSQNAVVREALAQYFTREQDSSQFQAIQGQLAHIIKLLEPNDQWEDRDTPPADYMNLLPDEGKADHA